MKAAVVQRYDKRQVDLEVKKVADPVAKDGEVLVRVVSAGVNPLDNMIVRGEVKPIVPYAMPLTAGNEMAGIVEEVGKNVSAYHVGDRVYARLPLDRIGAFAQKVAVRADALARIPDYLSLDEAAAVPLVGLTAMQALDLLDVKVGGRLFISGGTGGFGSLAIPLAKERGLVVVVSGSASNRQRVMDLGADRFIDYRAEDFADSLSGMDYVIDTLEGKELEREFSILKEGGHLVSLKGGPNGRFADRMGFSGIKKLLFGLVGRSNDKMASHRGATYDFVFVHADGAQLDRVSTVLEKAELHPSVDEAFGLDDVNEALRKVASGGSRGKTILKIEHEQGKAVNHGI